MMIAVVDAIYALVKSIEVSKGRMQKLSAFNFQLSGMEKG